MYSYEFPIPYPEMVSYTVICIICLVGAGWIIKHWLRGLICPHLVPVCLVILSFIVSNLYAGGMKSLFSLDINDVRAVTNGLAAVGLYEAVTKTLTHIRYRKIAKNHNHKIKKGKKVA